MAKLKDAASQRPAAGQPEQEAAPPANAQRKPLGSYLYAHTDIPKEITSFVTEKLGKGAEAHPPRADGGYKGRVLLNSDSYLVQAVGRNSQTAVVHRKGDTELMGSNLKWRDENKRLGSVDVQIHYDGDKGKVYSWNRQREDQQRMLSRAERFAKTITNEKDREAFLTNLKEMVKGEGKEQSSRQAPAQSQERSQARQPQQRERAAAGPER